MCLPIPNWQMSISWVITLTNIFVWSKYLHWPVCFLSWFCVIRSWDKAPLVKSIPIKVDNCSIVAKMLQNHLWLSAWIVPNVERLSTNSKMSAFGGELNCWNSCGRRSVHPELRLFSDIDQRNWSIWRTWKNEIRVYSAPIYCVDIVWMDVWEDFDRLHIDSCVP